MTVETVDAKVLSISTKESDRKHWPWLKVKARTSDNRVINIHIYPWTCRETQDIEVENTYTFDIWKQEKETYWKLTKIRAELI